MSEDEQVHFEIRAAIAAMPLEDRGQVLKCIEAMRRLRSEYGDAVYLHAIAFLGSEEAAKS